MTADEVREELLAGIDRALALGPVFGPTKKQRAVLEGCKRALIAAPELAEKIAGHVPAPSYGDDEGRS